MVAMYYGKVANDDEYNLVRAKYGDSTDAAAQVAALKELGLHARFITNGTTDDLRKQINSGRPVPVGWLHKGPVDAPSGGGHWSVVIGYKPGTWIVNDPNVKPTLYPVATQLTKTAVISSTATRTSTHDGSLGAKVTAGISTFVIH